MDFDSYRKRYGYRRHDPERYPEKGMIKGARRLPGDRWFIPEDVRPDYLIRKRADRRFEDDAFDIILTSDAQAFQKSKVRAFSWVESLR